MAFGEQCEECRNRVADYNTLVPDEGQVESFDYCETCSKDLCPMCFDNPCKGSLDIEQVSERHKVAKL